MVSESVNDLQFFMNSVRIRYHLRVINSIWMTSIKKKVQKLQIQTFWRVSIDDISTNFLFSLYKTQIPSLSSIPLFWKLEKCVNKNEKKSNLKKKIDLRFGFHSKNTKTWFICLHPNYDINKIETRKFSDGAEQV